MKCPKCQTENPDDSKFCKECATSLTGLDEDQPAFTKTLESPAFVFNQGEVLSDRYEILEKIGEGGMGEVYRALDRSLERQVAVKVLPTAFAEDAERLARFEREAKLLAVLNHSNVASIYGLEQSEGKRYLVLELAEGDTLKAKLDRGPLEIEEALDICRQTTEGLEAAHEKGIIHRDLKPGNIMVSPKGEVKILDFGLAKAFSGETTGTGIDIEKSPTITAQMTKPGVVMGTAAYMSPEQARGRAVDKRSDIWAFGCILFECLTGVRAFEGQTVSDNLALILKGEPDWTKLPAGTPTSIKSLLHRCLQRDPRYRIHHIADARIELLETPLQPSACEAVLGKRYPSLYYVIPFGIFVLLIGALIGVFIDRIFTKSPVDSAVRATIPLPENIQITCWARFPIRTEIAYAPDGSYFVFSASSDGSQESARIYKQTLDSLESLPIPGTEQGMCPFLSPDGKWLGFWKRHKVFKVSLSGGIPIELFDHAECPPYGAFWGHEENIFFGGSEGGLFRYSLETGIEELTVIDSKKDATHRLPWVLPGGKAVIFTSMPHHLGVTASIELLKLDTQERRCLIEDGADARYVPTGHLVFVRRGTLLAVPFDLDRLELAGDQVPIVDGVFQSLNAPNTYRNSGSGQFSVSASGSLIYASGRIIPDPERQVLWFDRNGNSEPLAGFENMPIQQVRISPDGKQLAYVHNGEAGGIWIYDFSRNIAQRFISEGRASSPVWAMDGKSLFFRGSKVGPGNIWRKSFDADAKWQQVALSDFNQYVGSLTKDGKYLAFCEYHPPKMYIKVMNLESGETTRISDSDYTEMYPVFSPDGRWLAYASYAQDRRDVYIRSFPKGEKEILVSENGGGYPIWARDGKELFYWEVGERDKLFKVDVVDLPSNSVGKPQLLFEVAHRARTGPIPSYDISHDDQKFLIIKQGESRLEKKITELNLVLNWFEELKRLVPTGK